MTKFEEVLQQIDSDFSAKLALQKLVSEGCDRNRIVELAYLYSRGASPDEANRTLRSARFFVDRWKRLSERLEQDANELEKAMKEMRTLGIAQLAYPEGQHPAVVMREIADFLDMLQLSLRPTVNRKSGRNQTLAYLCYLVKAATGKEHYREIAVLTNVFRQSEPDDIRLADSIRNRVARYEEENTIIYNKRRRLPLREDATEEVAAWQELSPGKTRSPGGRRKKRKNNSL